MRAELEQIERDLRWAEVGAPRPGAADAIGLKRRKDEIADALEKADEMKAQARRDTIDGLRRRAAVLEREVGPDLKDADAAAAKAQKALQAFVEAYAEALTAGNRFDHAVSRIEELRTEERRLVGNDKARIPTPASYRHPMLTENRAEAYRVARAADAIGIRPDGTEAGFSDHGWALTHGEQPVLRSA
ncbi:MAG TPA: hypothetical protein VGI92_05195 [Gemmatimonadales bacterium]